MRLTLDRFSRTGASRTARHWQKQSGRQTPAAITSIRKQFVSVLGIIVIVGIVSGNPDAYRPSGGFR